MSRLCRSLVEMPTGFVNLRVESVLGNSVGLAGAIVLVQSGSAELLLKEKTVLEKACSCIAGCGKCRKVPFGDPCPLFLKTREVF